MNSKMYLVIRYDRTRGKFFQVCFVDNKQKAQEYQNDDIAKIYPDTTVFFDHESKVTYVNDMLVNGIKVLAMYATVEINLTELFGIK